MIALLTGMVISSCRNHYTPSERLARINFLSERELDAAAAALDSIDPATLGETDSHYYDLLTVKIHDRTYRRQPTDTIIRSAAEYFAGYESLAGEAFYYTGRVFADNGDIPAALRFYRKALDNVPCSNSSLALRASINYHSGYLLSSMRLYDQAIPYVKESIRLSSLMGDSLNLLYDTEFLGTLFLNAGKYEDAEREIIKARKIALTAAPEFIWSEDMYLATIKYHRNEIDSALELIRPTLENIDTLGRFNALAIAAYIYRAAGRMDTALIYARRLINDPSPNNLNRNNGYEVALSQGSEKFLPVDTLLDYARDFSVLLQKEYEQNATHAVVIQNSLFNYENHERRRIEAEHSRDRFRTLLWITVAFLVASLVFIVVWYIVRKAARRVDELELNIALENSKKIKECLKIDSATPDELPSASIEDLRTSLRNELSDILQRNVGTPYKAPCTIMESAAYRQLQTLIENKALLTDDDNLWTELEDAILMASPDFMKNLRLLTIGRLTVNDIHTAILIKCGVSPSQMAVLFGRTKGTIVSRRDCLSAKVFDRKTSTSIIDGLIRCL